MSLLLSFWAPGVFLACRLGPSLLQGLWALFVAVVGYFLMASNWCTQNWMPLLQLMLPFADLSHHTPQECGSVWLWRKSPLLTFIHWSHSSHSHRWHQWSLSRFLFSNRTSFLFFHSFISSLVLLSSLPTPFPSPLSCLPPLPLDRAQWEKIWKFRLQEKKHGWV